MFQMIDGGKGSGNWGHKGRPGKRGGSGKGGGVKFRKGTKESGYMSAFTKQERDLIHSVRNSINYSDFWYELSNKQLKELEKSGISTKELFSTLKAGIAEMDKAEGERLRASTRGVKFSKAGDASRESIRSKLGSNSRIFKNAPEGAKEKIIKVVDNMDDRMAKYVESSLENVRLNWVDLRGLKEEEKRDYTSHYSEGEGTITIYESDPDEACEVFWHEYCHFIDDGKMSKSFEGKKIEGPMSYTLHTLSAIAEHGKEICDSSASDAEEIIKQFFGEDYTVKSTDSILIRLFDEKKQTYVWHSDHGFFEQTEKISPPIHKMYDELLGKDDVYEFFSKRGRPKSINYEDYFETYITPKRRLVHRKEKFKGATEAYERDSIRNAKEIQDWEDAHYTKELMDEYNKAYDDLEKRKKQFSPVADSMDAVFGGCLLNLISYGGHTPQYYCGPYSSATKAQTECTANFMQMLITNNTFGLSCMKKLMPRYYDVMMNMVEGRY